MRTRSHTHGSQDSVSHTQRSGHSLPLVRLCELVERQAVGRSILEDADDLGTEEQTQSHLRQEETKHRSRRRSRACVLPEAGERFVIGSGDERHMNPLAADFIAMQQTDGADGLLERTHVHPRLQLIVSVRTQIHTLHLRTHTQRERHARAQRERERERETHAHRERERRTRTERERDTHAHRERETRTRTERERERERDARARRERKTHAHRERERERDTHTHNDHNEAVFPCA